MFPKLSRLFRSNQPTNDSISAPAPNRPNDIAPTPQTAEPAKDDGYAERVKREIAQFSDNINVHDLPEIFHYWSHNHLLPMLKEFGFSGIEEFFAKNLLRSAHGAKGVPRFVSIGAGNCDIEISIAKLLQELGLKSFTLECLELNPAMLERGRRAAADKGIGELMVFTEADFNAWQPTGSYAGAIANHSLHHVTNLEGLFDAVKNSLHQGGYFIANDMIGRNGHQRWPEALKYVDSIWAELPDRQKYNHLLKRLETSFVNWDCSVEGFEGVRAQDILPLLVERFDFEVFIGFANVVSPFIDRCFGHNFNANSAADQALIDRLHAIDETGFGSGELKPTQMLAVMTTGKAESPRYSRGISPLMAIRPR